MTQITHIDYDSLLKIFLSNDDLRPSMMQANTVGDKTYSTDSNALIIIPNRLLKELSSCHLKAPNFQSVIEQLKDIQPIYFKDIDLFRIMEKQPKVYDESPCSSCKGEGYCPHCEQDCPDCMGSGYREDKSLPMLYNYNQTYIQIKDKMFSAFQMGRLEKVLLEMHAETFSIVKENKSALMFKIGEVELIICRMMHEGYPERPISILKPISNDTNSSNSNVTP